MKILIASRSSHKIREIREILSDLPVEWLSLRDFPGAPVVVENGQSYLENARKKAETITRFAGLPTLSDDSGIEVDALDGRPGIHSARWSGPGATDATNNQKLLDELKGVPAPRRTARYRAVIVVASPDGMLHHTEGTCEGVIAESPRGSSGFGYDPLFIVPGEGDKTMAELGMEVKNRISHRARALRALREDLKKLLD